jgi:hypothetical protein
MRLTPQELWDNPEALTKFMEIMDISHIKAVSTHPELADDPSNVIWEVAGDNRARGAAEMTGVEFNDATSEGRDIARDLTGNSNWWDMNDLFKGMMVGAETLGYAWVWLPKETWLDMMNTIRNDLPKIDQAQTFGQKVSAAKAFALKITHFFKKHGHHVAAAFMLAMLTIFWPPAAFFVAVWALTGVLGMAVHLLRQLMNKGGRKFEMMRLLESMDTPLAKFERTMARVRNFLDQIKSGIYRMAVKACDLFFGWATEVYKTIVKPFVQKIISKAKSMIVGFLNWAFPRPMLGLA